VSYIYYICIIIISINPGLLSCYTFSTDLIPLLTEVYQKCIDQGSIPNFISNATIHLLFKKGDRQEIGNWRPISLLNVDYKILSKIITERMKKCLPKILHPDQKGFVPTRRLEDAVIKASSLIDYCNFKSLPNYMILLDQEKAFDRVSRKYLHAILEKFNFPPLIRNAIKAMYAETTANISINGQLTSAVPLNSGVRQGCPLSPTLFALCIEPLGNLISVMKRVLNDYHRRDLKELVTKLVGNNNTTLEVLCWRLFSLYLIHLILIRI
jgi:hypothetical protein